jgi:CheY-like chemotaxis protein
MCISLFGWCGTKPPSGEEQQAPPRQEATKPEVPQQLVQKALSAPAVHPSPKSRSVRPLNLEQIETNLDDQAAAAASARKSSVPSNTVLAQFSAPLPIDRQSWSLPAGSSLPSSGNVSPVVVGTPAASDVSQSPPAPQSVRRRPQILVAEDVGTNQKIMEAVLRRALKIDKADIAMASDGKQALEFAKNKKFDLIITDHHMPSPDGVSLTRRLRQQSDSNLNYKTPIIAWTAHEKPEDRQLLEQAGVDGFLSKIVSQKEIKELAAKYFPLIKIPATPSVQQSPNPLQSPNPAQSPAQSSAAAASPVPAYPLV